MSETRLSTVAVLLSLFATMGIAQERPPAPVEVAEVFEDSARTTRRFVGSIVPERHVTIGSAVDGRVVSFPVDEGDRIEAKGALAELLTATIKLELKAAEAELAIRQAELEELENGVRPEELAAAKAEMDASRATYDFAKGEFDRSRKLAANSSISERELANASSTFTAALNAYASKKADYDLAKAGTRAERIAQASARKQMQEAIVEKLRDQITKHTIISRFAGYVVAEHTEEGAWVNRGDPIAEVVAIDTVHIRVSVIEDAVAWLRVDDPVRVMIPALDREFVGHIHIINPLADARSRTFPVKIRLKNEFTGEIPVLKPGMLATAMLPAGSEQPTLMVPKDALVLGGKTPVVYVVGKGGKVRPVPVTLGAPKQVFVGVDGELEPGDRVVILGNERLRPGAAVRIVQTRTRADLIAGKESSVTATSTPE